MADRFAILQQMGLATQQDPNDNRAWLELGNALGTDSIKVDGVVIDRTYCLTTCLNNDDYFWRAWFNLGASMGKTDKVTVRQQFFDRVACLTRCLELKDTAATARAWNILGASLPIQGKAVVGDRTVTPVECFVTALERDPSIAEAWHNLGLAAPAGATVSETQVSSRECVVKALERDPKLGRAWYSLAVQLYTDRIDNGQTTNVVVNGKSVDELECLRNALNYEPGLSHAWHLLGNTLRDGGGSHTTDIDGVKYNPRSATLKAIECDPRCALAWCNLAPTLGLDDTVEVKEEQIGAQGATLRSLEVLPNNPFAWYNLGVTLLQPNGPSRAEVGGKSYDADECFVEALRREPQYGPAWSALGYRLQGNDTVSVNGGTYDRFACIAKGELYGGVYSEKGDAPSSPKMVAAPPPPPAVEEEL